MAAEHGFALVHGAGLGAWIWAPVVPHLGSPALAIDLPGRGERSGHARTVGMEAAVQAVVAAIRGGGVDRVVLVGHSLGATVALGAASRLGDRVARVVLVGGGVPPSGANYFSAVPTGERLFLRIVVRLRMAPPKAAIRRALCTDLDESTTRTVVERTVLPEPRGMYTEAVDWSGIPAQTRLTYVKLLGDRAVSPALQDRFITRLGRADVITIDTGHLPMLSRPEELAAALEKTTC